jgi:hypothetical protein
MQVEGIEYVALEEYQRTYELKGTGGLFELTEEEALERTKAGAKVIKAGSWLKAKASLGLPVTPMQFTLLQQQVRHHSERRALVVSLLPA